MSGNVERAERYAHAKEMSHIQWSIGDAHRALLQISNECRWKVQELTTQSKDHPDELAAIYLDLSSQEYSFQGRLLLAHLRTGDIESAKRRVNKVRESNEVAVARATNGEFVNIVRHLEITFFDCLRIYNLIIPPIIQEPTEDLEPIEPLIHNHLV